MGVTADWEDEQHTVIRIVFQGNWNNEEFRNAGLQVVLMMANVRHMVYVINDFRASDALPIGVLWQARNLSRMRPVNWGGAVIITTDFLVTQVAEVFKAVYMLIRHSQSLYFAGTNEEALKIIARMKQENRVS